MSIGSWFHKLFHHVNAHNLAGALASGKTTIDQLGSIEGWAWLPQFNEASDKAIAALSAWQKGQPTDEIQQSLNLAVNILNGVEGLSEKDKAMISVFVGSANAALAFIG